MMPNGYNRSAIKVSFKPLNRTLTVGCYRSQHQNKQAAIDFFKSLILAEQKGIERSDEVVAEYILPDGEENPHMLDEYKTEIRVYTPLKPCVTCGADVEFDRLDSLYPTDRTFTQWHVICKEHNLGCGRIVYAPTKEQAIQRWNDGESHVEK